MLKRTDLGPGSGEEVGRIEEYRKAVYSIEDN